MSVEVCLDRRQFGNAFFRYIHARVFAEINNLKMLMDLSEFKKVGIKVIFQDNLIKKHSIEVLNERLIV